MRIWIFALVGALVVAGCKRSGSSGSTVTELAARTGPAVASGRLPANKEGVVDLPQNVQSVSGDQKAYLTRNADGTTWVLLPQRVNSPADFKGLLYCTKPPAEKPATVRVVGPKGGGGGGAPTDVTVDEDLKDGWYAVHAGG